jgi:D-aminopeptidase
VKSVAGQGSIISKLVTGSMAEPTPGSKRARELGVPLDGIPGPWNSITDVRGVEVGHVTLLRDVEPPFGRGTTRTGVTAILPRGKEPAPAFSGWFSLNGNGELTGTTWIDESGLLDGPILSTNTNSVGIVRDAVLTWAHEHGLPQDRWSLPVVGETWDGYLNDITGSQIQPDHAIRAMDSARSGPVPEGSVGGGTGMVCYDYKGGIGTASRQVSAGGDWTIGALVQANQGSRSELVLGGIPAGKELPSTRASARPSSSIVVFVGTDAPLLPHQLKRLARRCSLGLARTGTTSHNSSGDLFLAFSTANHSELADARTGPHRWEALPDSSLDPVFEAVVQCTEESILNALFAGRTMVGYQGHTVEGFPTDSLPDLLRRFGRQPAQ